MIEEASLVNAEGPINARFSVIFQNNTAKHDPSMSKVIVGEACEGPSSKNVKNIKPKSANHINSCDENE